MTVELYLGIDQGSSSTKAALLDASGALRGDWSIPVPPQVTDGRRVEQDAEGLVSSVVEAFLKAKRRAEGEGATIRGFGLGVQRSGVLAWRASDGVPVHPVITWADTRTQPIIEGFGRGVEQISAQTGVPVLANFAAPKIQLLQRQFLDVSTYVGTLDSFLLYRLSGRSVFVTEDTMASRTMLYSLAQRGWSDELCRHFKVDMRRLARIYPSLSRHSVFEGVPLVAMLGDQQAALLGRGEATKRALLNLGTIASLTRGTGGEPFQRPGLKTNVLYSRAAPVAGERECFFLSEVTSPVTGSVLREPLRRGWCASTDELQRLCDESCRDQPAGLATAYFINRQDPSPVWPQGVPNVMVCKPGATIADRARAVVENVGNIIARMLEEFSDKGLLGEGSTAEIDVAGGGSELPYLMQYVSDVTGHTLHKYKEREAGARGAAIGAWMFEHPEERECPLSGNEVATVFRCENPERRKRYLMWQRLEQDVLRKSLPPSAEIEE